MKLFDFFLGDFLKFWHSGIAARRARLDYFKIVFGQGAYGSTNVDPRMNACAFFLIYSLNCRSSYNNECSYYQDVAQSTP